MEHTPLAQHHLTTNQRLHMEQLRKPTKPHHSLHIIHTHDNHTMENYNQKQTKKPKQQPTTKNSNF